MPLQLYETYARSVRPFRPLNPPHVGLYACGLTVYDYAHLGNLRTYLFEDLLRRTLEVHDYEVTHVVNITDVGHLVSDADMGEDKMEKGSRRTGKSAWEIAAEYTDAFRQDLRHLNILEPTIWCKATDHIQEMIALVQCIEAQGYAYLTADGVYFDTSRLEDYGHLARLDIGGLRAGARVDVAGKRHPTDFALWKLSPKDAQRQMEWESPWGVGFPGWHIECSAMAEKHLGPFFDIHCGGEDHIPVHHTNEIAQTQACHGTRLANFWLHGYFLETEGERMAKSAGDFLRLQTVIDRGYDPLVFRYYCLNAHYRRRLTFTWAGMDAAATGLGRLRAAVHGWGVSGAVDEVYLQRFQAEVDRDLNLPRALAVTWDLVNSDLAPADKRATIEAFDRVLGLGLAGWQPPRTAIPDGVMALVRRREAARLERRWQEADRLREEIAAAGFEVRDTSKGPDVRPS